MTPWRENSQFAAYGAIATVLVDRLRVRQGAGLALPLARSGNDETFILSKGDQVLIAGGPMDVDGYRWYSVELDTSDGGGAGWIAGAEVVPGREPADDGWLISIPDPVCPESVGFDQVRYMTDWAIDACGVKLTRIRGMIDSCYEGSMGPFAYSPEWAWFTCTYVRDPSSDPFSSRWYPIYFPPDYAGRHLERGDVVVLTGSLGVDESRYGRCTVEPYMDDEPSLVAIQPTVQFSFAQACRHHFVVSDATKLRHVDLEPLF